MSITEIPLSSLSASKRNVRKTGGQNISDLAASIAAHGLLQNLTVTAAGGKHEVVAGGRRLLALQQLAKAKTIPNDYPVPCHIIHIDSATEVSLAENIVREAMHPADQFDAFQALADSGHGVAAIAGAYGVSDAVVKQRLKLAKVSPKLIADYRASKMTLDTLQAFSITDDKPRQERVWKEASTINKDYQDGFVRRHLTDGEVEYPEDDLAKFVGIDVYESAGGFVRRDLFSNAIYLEKNLVDRLATSKLDACAIQLKAEGWSWVEIKREYFNSYAYDRKKATKREPTAEENKQLQAIEKKMAPLRKRREVLVAIEDEAEMEATETECDQVDDQLGDLDEQRQAVLANCEAWSAKVMKVAGVVIELSGNGFRVHRGLVKPIDKKKAEREKEMKKAGKDGEPEGSELSDAMHLRLTAHRTAVLQLRLAQRPHVALAVLAYSLLQGAYGAHWHASLGSATLHPYQTNLDSAGVSSEYQPRIDLAQITEDQRAEIPDEPAAALRWLIESPPEEVQELLASCVAICFNATTGKRDNELGGDRPDLVAIVSEACELDMTKYWQPTRELFLDLVPKSVIVAAVTEATGAEIAQPLLSKKKADAAQIAAEILEDRNWLPAPLRINAVRA